MLLPDILPPSGRFDFIIGGPCIAGGGWFGFPFGCPVMRRFISSADGIPGVGVADGLADLPVLEAAGVPSGTGLSVVGAERVFVLAESAVEALLVIGMGEPMLVFAFVRAIFTFGEPLIALFDAEPAQDARKVIDSDTSRKGLTFIASFQYSCAGWWMHPKGTGTFRPTGTWQVLDR